MSETDFEKRMRLAVEEMERGGVKDPSAEMQVFPANREITTSAKIAYHDVPWEQIRNAHPHLESSDVEALLAYCYGDQSIYEAAPNFEAFDRSKLEEVLSLSPIEAAKLAGSDDPLLDYGDEDDEEE